MVLGLAILVATIYSLVDAIRIDSSRVKHIDKIAWVLLIIFIPLVGTILWWTMGREYWPRPSRTVEVQPYRASREPLTDDEIDAAVEAEITRHENEARIRRLERELRDLKGE